VINNDKLDIEDLISDSFIIIYTLTKVFPIDQDQKLCSLTAKC
jgi:hypothetical protein